MSEWEDIEPQAKASTPAAPVKFGMFKAGKPKKDGERARARGTVLIRKDVLASLGMKTWRVKIRVGKGERAHQIAIVPDPDGPFELQQLNGGRVEKGAKMERGDVFRVRLPVIERFPDQSIQAVSRPYKVEKEAGKMILVIDLPAYCFDVFAKKRAMGAAA